MYRLITSLLISLFLCLLCACNTKDQLPKPAQETPTTYGKLKISFVNRYENIPFELDKKYLLKSNDTISISLIKYVISNITLVDSNFGIWKENNSYYIIDQENTNTIIIDSIPTKKYFKLSLDLGFTNNDLTNTSLLTIQNSEDAAETMLSDDKTSNLHIKIDGDYYTNLDTTGSFTIRNKTKSYSSNYLFGDLTPHRTSHNVPHTPVNLVIEENKTVEIEINADIYWLFNSPYAIDFDNPDYRNNLNTTLFSNYNSGFFTYKMLLP